MTSITIFNEKIKDSITMSNTLDNIEAIILKYERMFKILLRKRSWLLKLSRKLCPTSKILFLKEDLYLYLLRNNLYIKNTTIRKLIKPEILKAPEFRVYCLYLNHIIQLVISIMKIQILSKSIGLEHPSVKRVIEIAEDIMNKNKILNAETLYNVAKKGLKLPRNGLLFIIQFLINKKIAPNYQIGSPEFDLDETIQHNPLNIYNKSLSYKDIFGIQRKKQKRKIVMILDSSGSMYGKLLLNAALTTSVLAYNMEKESYGIVLFNSTAMVLKKIDEKKPVITIIDEILDSEAVGFTNINIGLEKGLKELNKIKEKTRHKFGILITDGNYNRGKNPIDLVKKYPKLHVIGIPAENDADRGIDTCREIARVGKGKFFAVHNYKEIPRALIELLSQV